MTLEEAVAERDAAIAERDNAFARLDELGEKLEITLARITQLESQVEELKEKVNKSSRNSDKPPSSDPPWLGPSHPPGQRPRKKRRGFWRRMLDEKEVDRIVSLSPQRCGGCGRALCGNACGKPHRHQVIELPPVCAVVTEYQLQALKCSQCNKVTRAKLPKDIGWSWFGPRLMAQIAMLSSEYRLSKRQIQSLLKAQWNVSLSRGEITKIERRMSMPLATVYEEACARVRASPVAYADETPWKEQHELHWLWTAGTKAVIVFRIHEHRTTAAAKELLSENFAGTLVSDRYAAYSFVPMERRQVCWAHLLREFIALSEMKEPVAKYVAEKVLDRITDMFAIWRDYQNQTLDRQQRQIAIRPVCRDIEAFLELGAKASHDYVRSKCRSILRHRPSLFLFVEHEGVEPTNNRSERALRHAVIYRKLSHGTQSQEGSRFVERMLTVVQTLKAQGRNVYDYLTAVASSALQGTSAPSILPA